MLLLVALVAAAVQGRVHFHREKVGDDCDCSWVSIPGACNNNDGSYCWNYCCGGGNTPTPPPNNPPPPPPSGDWKPVPLVEEYRRRMEWVSTETSDSNGFDRQGGMRYHSEKKYNFLGGGLQFDVDLSGVQDMVNANLYLVIPGTLQYDQYYCDNSDGMVSQGKGCIELDIMESNGHQLVATTMHTKLGHNSGCDTWGCRTITNDYTINFNQQFQVQMNVASDGDIQVYFNQGGNSMCAFCGADGWDGAAKAAVVDAMSNHGAVIVSSMWTGWVPPNQSGTGDLDGSHYRVSNLVYKGSEMGNTFAAIKQLHAPPKKPLLFDDCDCSWISIPGACDNNDGSYCWNYCCGGGNTPTPPPNSPPPPPPSGDWTPVDLVEEYRRRAEWGWERKNRVAVADSNGFSRQGSMRYHSQQKLNLLGGGLQFTVDLSGVNDMVNANLYLVIPGTLQYDQYYCDNSDGMVAQGKGCIELDIMESNGHQLVATTMHTKLGHNSGCDTWGCRTITNDYTINFNQEFQVQVNVAGDGDIQVYFVQGGNSVCAFCGADGWDGAAKAAVVDGMSNHGAVIVSSMWTGWVPPNQSGTGDLDGSHYTVKNVVMKGNTMGPTL